MADGSSPTTDGNWSRIARLAPALCALAFVLVLSASVGRISGPPPDPRAVLMLEEGQQAMARGELNSAVDAFEAALALDPGYNDAFVGLADATLDQGLAGKAIGYYRLVLKRDPANFAALAGEGTALVAQGSVDRAKRNLASLQSLCGAKCPETLDLERRIAEGPPTSLAAETAADGPSSN